MNNEWHAPKSGTRLALSVVFIIGAIVWMACFGIYTLTVYAHSTPDKFVVFFGIAIGASLLFVGFAIASSAKTRQVIPAFLYLLVFLCTLPLIPVPNGYGETVLGIYFLLWSLPVILYARHEKSKKKK